MKMLPVVFDFTEITSLEGEVLTVMVPQARYAKVAARQFQQGEAYPLVVLETRSRASHNQFFAAVQDGFDNLPEDLAGLAERMNFKTIPPGGWVDANHLRKWALCETGWCDVSPFDFDTKEQAMRLAKFYRAQDLYAQIIVRGTHVVIKIPKSQSAAAMAKQPFEDSKRAVLDLIESMVGVKRGTLKKQAGKSA